LARFLGVLVGDEGVVLFPRRDAADDVDRRATQKHFVAADLRRNEP
jgi:hypothetical protein